MTNVLAASQNLLYSTHVVLYKRIGNYDKLFKEIGMAVPKSTYTRVGMIKFKGHLYFFPTPIPNEFP